MKFAISVIAVLGICAAISLFYTNKYAQLVAILFFGLYTIIGSMIFWKTQEKIKVEVK